MRLLAIVGIASGALLAACGDDGPAAADASTDAGGPDADPNDRCPGELTFEALVADLLTGAGAVDTEVVDKADPGNTTTAAPNGRAVLCLPIIGTSHVEATHASFLPHLQTVEASAAGLHRPIPFPFPMLTPSDADTFIGGLVTARDPSDTQLLIDVRSYPGGDPATGATVAIATANDGAFVRNGADVFVSGNELLDDSTVLFANVGVSSGMTAITVTPPAGKSCVGPSTVMLEQQGGLSSAFFSCQ